MILGPWVDWREFGGEGSRVRWLGQRVARGEFESSLLLVGRLGG